MTDRDVVERVPQQFGTAVMAIDRGRYRTEFAASLKGEGAVEFMKDLKPLMGNRRQHAIDAPFAAIARPVGNSISRWLRKFEFLWLAGWLEGEGSFLAPPLRILAGLAFRG